MVTNEIQFNSYLLTHISFLIFISFKERQTNQQSLQLEKAQEDKLELESKKRELENQLAQVQKFLQVEKTGTREAKDKVKNLETKVKKKNAEISDLKEKKE